MTVKNRTLLFYCLFLSIILQSCSAFIDIYQSIPLGSKLSKQLLEEAKQLFPHDQGLILLHQVSYSPYNYDYYLLFFDLSSKLEAACLIPKNGIQDFSKNIITSYADRVYEERKPDRRNNLPESISLNVVSCGTRSERVQNKVISDLDLIGSESPNSLKLKIKFYQAERNFYLDVDEIGIENIPTHTNEIILDLGDVHFDWKEIYTVDCSSNSNQVKYDYYMFLAGDLDSIRLKIHEHFTLAPEHSVAISD